jgi:tetratricopeptide (TPR) repeat protein
VSILRFAIISLLLVFLLTCGRLDATREFNYGIKYYNDEQFETAIHFFERASENFSNPAIGYNLALAHLAWLRESTNADVSPQTGASPQDIASALRAVRSARELPELPDAMLAKLFYIEGSIHVIANDEAAARAAFAKSLSAEADFKPTLKVLVQLDPGADSPTARFILAAAEVDDLEPEEKLSP